MSSIENSSRETLRAPAPIETSVVEERPQSEVRPLAHEVNQTASKGQRGLRRLAIKHFFMKIFRGKSLSTLKTQLTPTSNRPQSFTDIDGQNTAQDSLRCVLSGRFKMEALLEYIGYQPENLEAYNNQPGKKKQLTQDYNDAFSQATMSHINSLSDAQLYRTYHRLHSKNMNVLCLGLSLSLREEGQRLSNSAEISDVETRIKSLRANVVTELKERLYKVPDLSFEDIDTQYALASAAAYFPNNWRPPYIPE